eukprot:CAMPEP_0179442448 /NCGR_PEP_ID=MMETSP0799-20121207/25967_1 /TAXON_ID=46947 /ORGANISM="Geminigera cryophila, Strain CCMP2564" /LENGTH=192 /DNA_ID=CAMNT_0021227647 /DNA_START=183 /DNA_END=759 /DNA_ORIENTATION=-
MKLWRETLTKEEMTTSAQRQSKTRAYAEGGWGRDKEGEWEDLWALEALEALVADRGERKEYRVRFYTGDQEGDGVATVAYINLIGDRGMSGERPLSYATFLPPPSATKLPAARPVRGGWRRDSSASVFCAPLLLPCKTGGELLGRGRRTTFSIKAETWDKYNKCVYVYKSPLAVIGFCTVVSAGCPLEVWGG